VADDLNRVIRLLDREMSLEEADAYLRAPLDESEVATTLELAEWFCRRYPTPLQRLQYVTRATRRWRRQQAR
jgi:hypothetical protein